MSWRLYDLALGPFSPGALLNCEAFGRPLNLSGIPERLRQVTQTGTRARQFSFRVRG